MNGEPERLKRRPHHGRFPIPFVTQVTNGVPDFRVHSDERREMIGKRKLCQLCGDRIRLQDGPAIFAGTERSCLLGVFGEPPMHRECAEFAWTTCPWLLGRDFRPIEGDPHIEVLERPRIETLYFVEASKYVMIRDTERGQGYKYKALKIGDTIKKIHP